MKQLFKVLVMLIILLAIVAVVLFLNLDKGIKAAVENVGPRLTQSKVELRDVDLSLTTGEGRLQGLIIGNPAGFSTENAFSLGEISLAIDTDTVASDTLVINKLHIIAPEINYESAKGVSNLDQLQRNVQEALGSNVVPAEDGTTESASKKLIIRDLQITDGKISYSNPLLGKAVPLALPPIKLKGIGEKSNGATAAEVTAQILGAINKEATGAISQSDALKNLGNDALKEGKSKLEDALGGFKGLLKKD